MRRKELWWWCDYLGSKGYGREAEVRTQAEIIAQLEKRYAELERQAHKPEMRFPCKTCRFKKSTKCNEPLVKGFKDEVCNWDLLKTVPNCQPEWLSLQPAYLCGPEKALWAPIPVKLTFWQRVMQWLHNTTT